MGGVGPLQTVIIHQIWPKREKEAVHKSEENDSPTMKEMENEVGGH